MSYEASEIMAAAALMYKPRELNEYIRKGEQGIVDLILSSRTNIEKNKFNIYFSDDNMKKGFLSVMVKTNARDMVQGISAALGIRKFMKNTNGDLSVYMTGNKWPKDVERFRIKAYGFDDYNSSDFIVKPNSKNEWYGISLKKKNTVNAADPTLINKAFDSIFKGVPDPSTVDPNVIKTISNKLNEERTKYFAGLVVDASKKGIIYYGDINRSSGQKFKSLKELENFSKNASGQVELFKAKNKDPNIFKLKYNYINTKGGVHPDFIKVHPEGYLWNPPKGVLKSYKGPSMRGFVNSELGKKNNELWASFVKIINENSELIGDALINIILKTNLYTVGKNNQALNAETFTEEEFKFALVTGIGQITKGKVNMTVGNVMPLKTTLCGLSRIMQAYPQPYKVILSKNEKSGQDDNEDEGGAAKVFLTLQKGDLDILDLELRYKGEFNSQPQFQGFLTKKFKDLLKKECSGGKG